MGIAPKASAEDPSSPRGDVRGGVIVERAPPAVKLKLLSTPISAHIAGYERVVGTHLGVHAKAER
jgi:hypothetical protein